MTTTLVVDSITQLTPRAAGAVAVSGSHGGIIAAWYAAKTSVRAAVFNDAGVGKDGAGIAGLDYLQRHGIAACAVGHDTARIGDGLDTLENGIVRHMNALARRCGCRAGARARDAVAALATARPPSGVPPPERESRVLLVDGPVKAWAIDSVVLAVPEDRGQVFVCGSHGGLHGGRAETALTADAFAALFNDAGIGKDGAGTTRLPVLDGRGIAAATVAAMSARIGEARSTYEDGVISVANNRATRLGVHPGMTARAFVARMLAAAVL